METKRKREIGLQNPGMPERHDSGRTEKQSLVNPSVLVSPECFLPGLPRSQDALEDKVIWSSVAFRKGIGHNEEMFF